MAITSYSEPNRFTGKDTTFYDGKNEVQLTRVHEYDAYKGKHVFKCYRIDFNGDTQNYGDTYAEARAKAYRILKQKK